MLQPKPATQLSTDEYLHGEQFSTVKHQLIDGVAYAMAGAGTKHNLLATNCSRIIGNQLNSDNSVCFTFVSDMKVHTSGNFYYPDVMVCCESDEADLFKEKPLLIIEILSKSTRSIDKISKLHDYTQLDSLHEYVMIEQDFVDIEVLRRSNGWISEHFYLGSEVTFESVGVTVAVAEIYRRVNNEDMREWLQQLQDQDVVTTESQ